jgi:DNA-binding transcriptional ArsR family regulator
MRKTEPSGEKGGRLPRRLMVTLDPDIQDALDNPVRRELLRTLDRRGNPVTVGEVMVELRPYRRSQLGYHLQVLLRAGVVASEPEVTIRGDSARYASEMSADGSVRAVLRATEHWDRERREAMAASNASPLLTMFRVPRPVRTIRLRSQGRIDAERDC